MAGTFTGVSASGQVEAWQAKATDERPRLGTGWAGMDSLLDGGGFSPGTLVVLGGRTHTRKTTVMLNWIVNLLKQEVPVGLVSLDEPLHSYVAKLASCISGQPHAVLEQAWHQPVGDTARAQYKEVCRKLSMTKGYRPDFDQLTGWLELAKYDTGETPRVVFLDYTSLLTRDKYAGQEVQRVSRLIEDLQVWTNENELVTVALHQVGRMDERGSGRYHGDTPMSLESLKYGGEEIADVVLGTFRPSLDPLGNMTMDQARMVLGDRFDDDAYAEAKSRVAKYNTSTFLQLLKNRPGVHLHQEGLRLLSRTESLRMEEPEDTVTETGFHVVHGGA